MIVGIAPGFKELEDGIPFVGQSGHLADTVVRACGMNPEDIFWTNLCCWRPPDDHPSPEDIEACLPRLRTEIEAVRPQLIIPMGAIAAEVFTGHISHARGKNGKFSIAKVRGQPLWYDNVLGTSHSCRVMPTWHPAAFLRESGQTIIMDICRDFQKLMPLPKGQDLLNSTGGHNGWSWHLVDSVFKPVEFPYRFDPDYPIAIDIETGNPENVDEMTMDVFQERIICFSVAQSTPCGTHSIVFTPHSFDSFITWFKLFGYAYKWLTHYGFFDKQGLRRHFGIDLIISEDTLSASYALDERQGVHSLKSLAREYCGASFWEAPVHEAIKEWQRKQQLLALAASPELLSSFTNEDLCDASLTLEKNPSKAKGEPFFVGSLGEKYGLDGDFHRSRRTMDADHLGWYNSRLEAIKNTGWDIVPPEIMYSYNAEDAARTAQLLSILTPMMEDDGVLDLYRSIMIPDMNVNADIAYEGLHIDTEKMDDLVLKWGPLWQTLHDELVAEATERGFVNEDGSPLNLASPRQKARWIWDTMQITPPVSKHLTTSTGQQSTNIKIIAQVKNQDDWLQKYIAFTHLDHFLGAYVLPMPGFIRDDGKVHAQWKPHSARTGRDAFAGPPWHQLPKHAEDDEEFQAFIGSTGHEIREMVDEPDDDYCFVMADYKTGELYIMAYVSGDDNLLEDCRTGDPHRATAANRLFHIPMADVTDKQKRDAKFVNFGMLFGMQEEAMAKDQLHVPVWEAAAFMKEWWDGYPAVRRYVQERKLEAMNTGEIVNPYTGRKRRFRLILGDASFHELNQAVNTNVQGTLGDYQKDSRIKLHRELPQFKGRVASHCHDEITCRVYMPHFNESCKLIKEIMEEPKFGLPGVPVDMKFGKSWGHGEPVVFKA